MSCQGGTKLRYKGTLPTAFVRLCTIKMMMEAVDLNSVEWQPCSRRARKFVTFNGKPVTIKANWKAFPKLITSAEHSVKGYTDDVALISNDFVIHVSVLKAVDQKAGDLDLSQMCVSYLFDGFNHSKGTAQSITEGGTKFLGKLIDVSLRRLLIK